MKVIFTLLLGIISVAVPAQQKTEPVRVEAFRLADSKFRFVDKINKKPVNEYVWEEAEPFVNGFAKVYNQDGWTFVNGRGTRVSKNGYGQVRNFKNHLAAVKRNSKWGFIDESGNEVISPVFDFVHDFAKNLAAVYDGKEWRFINRSGIFVADADQDWLSQNRELIKKNYTQSRPFASNNAGNNLADNNLFPGTNKQEPGVVEAGGCPPNISFENGSFANWSCFIGSTACVGGVNTTTLNPSAPIPNRHTLITRATPSALDPWGFFPTNPPDGSNFCVRLGNAINGAQAERISYTVTVPSNATNYSITYRYAVVFQDPSHLYCEQPRFSAKLFDPLTNSYLPCGTYEYVSTGSIPGFLNSPLDPDVKYKPWSEAFINLTPYAGRTLDLEFTTVDCTRGGHWGYAYLDVDDNCNLTASVQYNCTPPNITILTGPPGFQFYNWWDFNFSTLLGTGQTLTLNPGLPIGTNLWVEVLPYSGLGCRDTLPVTIVATWPVADFTLPAAQCLSGNNFTFTSTSTVASGFFTAYDWDFGDGNTGSGITVNHSYAAAGSYPVKLVVTTNNNCRDSLTRVVVVYPQPTANFNPPSGQCLTGNNFSFTSTSAMAGGTIVSQQWDFGDGNTGSGINVNHSYTTAGSFSVKLVVTSDRGCKDSMTKTVNVYPQPLAAYNQPAAQCFTGNNFSFTSNSTVTGGLITSHNWNFGDGNTGNGMNVTHRYAVAGTYTVKLVVTTNNGCKDSVSKTVIVYADPIPGIIADRPLVFCAGDSVHLLSNSLAGSGIITGLQWYKGGVPTPGATGTMITVFQSGNYQLEVTNSNGCKKLSGVVAVIVNPLPVGSIVLPNNNFICDGTPVILHVNGAGNSFQWYMNGILVPGATGPDYSALIPGLYTVQMTSPQGCRNMASGSVNLSLLKKPVPAFEFPLVCAGMVIQFTNQSDTAFSGPVNWLWDFGDGYQSALLNPVHTYTTGNDYSVVMSITPVICPNLFTSLTRIVHVEKPRPGIRYPVINAIVNVNKQLQARNFGSQYLWTPSTGLNNPQISNPVYNYNQPAEYIIRIQTAAGCVTYDTQLVRMFRQIDIQVPKAFTPNGDGHNDRLDIFLIGIVELRFFKVFNRWGQLMFETNDPLQLWDGTYHGVKQPLETYVWIAEGIGYDGSTIVRRGQTVLIR